MARSSENIKKVGQAHKNSLDSMKKARVMNWWEHMNRSEMNVIAHSLKDIIRVGPTGERDMMKYAEKKMPILITNNICRTSPSYTLSNLPKVKDWQLDDLNFAFGENIAQEKENVDKMMQSEKVVLCYFAHEYENQYGAKKQIVRMYAVAPELVDTDLPYIYRVDILTNSENNEFYAVRGSAVIGGCIDGGCKIFEMGVADDENARLFRFKSGQTNRPVDYEDDVDNRVYRVTEVQNIKNLSDATNYAFSLLNITSRRNVWSDKCNLAEITKSMRQTNATEPITGAEMIETIIQQGVHNNSKKVYQQVNESGQLRGTTNSGTFHGGRRKQEWKKF